MTHPVRLLKQSHALIVQREPELARRFYDGLFAAHPEMKRLFRRTGKPEQERMLARALSAVVDHLDDRQWLDESLAELGRRHVYYGVEPEMYDWFVDGLLVTLREVGHDSWTDAHDRAWRGALVDVATCMKRGARMGVAARDAGIAPPDRTRKQHGRSRCE